MYYYLAVNPFHLGQGHLRDCDGVQAENYFFFGNLRRKNFGTRRDLRNRFNKALVQYLITFSPFK
jgi:hypothetical protein